MSPFGATARKRASRIVALTSVIEKPGGTWRLPSDARAEQAGNESTIKAANIKARLKSGIPHLDLTIGDAVDVPELVVADIQRAVGSDSKPDGSSQIRPALQPAGHEIHNAAGLSAGERDEYDFIAGRNRAIPRAVKRDERAALVRRREHGAVIKDDAERCGVRLHRRSEEHTSE